MRQIITQEDMIEAWKRGTVMGVRAPWPYSNDTDHPHVYKVFVRFNEEYRTAVVLNKFYPWGIWANGSEQCFGIDELTDDEILDALKMASEVADSLETEGWAVRR